ncbi:IS110 family transposase [Nocardia sp. NPDC052278]|uniref:IS110 family transposase n=1 Tax=unclassified Nocardia TaxID=2637762 RepID=UPI00367DE44E
MCVPEICWVDIGKEHHHCVVINADGDRLLSRRMLNDEAELLALLGDVLAISTDTLWALDLNHGGVALLIGLLLGRDQPMAYLTGLGVHRASATHRSEGKTDAKDAFVIADQARLRRDLGLLRPGDEIAVDLCTLTNRRLDVVFDRTRRINRLGAQLLKIFPAPERSLDLATKGPIMLLSGYQVPAAIRRAGAERIETWLRNSKVRNAAARANRAAAAESQHTTLPGEKLAAAMARLAKAVIALDAEIAELDTLIEDKFREHPHAEVIISLPGMRPLGAEFLASTGGHMDAFGSADRLAGFAGLAPRPRDSARVGGNLRKPKRYHRGLVRRMYLSAMVSITTCPASKAYYRPKRSEGQGHKQALHALARRRLNVLWAMIRDRRCDQSPPPVTTAA